MKFLQITIASHHCGSSKWESVPPVSPVRTQAGDSWEKMTRQVKSSGNLKFWYGRRMGFLSVCRYFLPNRGKSRSRRTKQSGLPAIDHRLTIPRKSATLSLEVTSSHLKSILTSGITCISVTSSSSYRSRHAADVWKCQSTPHLWSSGTISSFPRQILESIYNLAKVVDLHVCTYGLPTHCTAYFTCMFTQIIFPRPSNILLTTKLRC